MNLLLLPLPLSALDMPSLVSALRPFTEPLSRSISMSSVSWTEDDDEPFAALGMGAAKRKAGRRLSGEMEGLGMYT